MRIKAQGEILLALFSRPLQLHPLNFPDVFLLLFIFSRVIAVKTLHRCSFNQKMEKMSVNRSRKWKLKGTKMKRRTVPTKEKEISNLLQQAAR